MTAASAQTLEPRFTLDEALRILDSSGQRTWVYFIRELPDGPVKVGVAANPRERLATLQCGNPRPLAIIALHWGLLRTERQLHTDFVHYRLRGEWFEPAPELLELAERIGDPDALKEYSA